MNFNYKKTIILLILVITLLIICSCDDLTQSNNQITITFNSNGGSEVIAISGEANSPIIAPSEPIRDGYSFGGWYSETEYNNIYVFTVMPSADIILFARWLKLYTLTFDSNGGSAMDGLTQGCLLPITEPSSPLKDNYAFGGWYSDAEFNNIFIFTVMPSENITLYAKWLELYTITFHSNGGDDMNEITQGCTLPILLPEALMNGFTFAGWYTDIELNNYFSQTTMPSENIDLYADWGTDELIYTVYNNSVCRVGANASISANNIKIPKRYQGKEVIQIGSFRDCILINSIEFTTNITTIIDRAFYNCSGLNSLIIPSTVYEIGESAFGGVRGEIIFSEGSIITSLSSFDYYAGTTIVIPSGVTSLSNIQHCPNLLNVNIPDSVTSIGYDTFYASSNLVSITIPSSVTKIGSNAFASISATIIFSEGSTISNLGGSVFRSYRGTSIILPSSLTSLEERVFYNCSELTDIIIPDSVTSIGYEAFYNCTKLNSITISSCVTSIGINAFDNIEGTIIFPEESIIDNIGDYLFAGYKGTSITLPNSIKSIGERAFFACKKLINVNIPLGVISLGEGAFLDCSSLSEITIPASVAHIGLGAFGGCINLQVITIDFANIEYSSLEGVLYNKDKTLLIRYPLGKEDTSFNIPASVIEIENDAFSLCINLIEIIISSNVTNIGDYAFCHCSNLNNLIIPSSVTNIGIWAFSFCESLQNIRIPSSVISIGQDAFSACNSLTSIYIDRPVTEGITTGSSGMFISYKPIFKIYINDEASLSAYKEAEYWSNYKAYIYPKSIIDINGFAINENVLIQYTGNDENVTIPDNVLIIGTAAFAYKKCSYVTIASSVTSLGNQSFMYCSNLISIIIPSSVTSIGYEVFKNCLRLKSITIGSGVTAIGQSILYSCSSLKSVYVNRPSSMGITPAGQTMFINCNSDFNIFVPDEASVTAYKAANYWNYFSNNIYCQ